MGGTARHNQSLVCEWNIRVILAISASYMLPPGSGESTLGDIDSLYPPPNCLPTKKIFLVKNFSIFSEIYWLYYSDIFLRVINWKIN